MVPPETPALLNETLGFELTELGDARAFAHVLVTDRVMQPMGLVHGGVYAALAESLVSAATHEAVRGEGFLAVGMSNLTSFVRPVTDGKVFAEATRLHRGRTSWVWEVRLTDDAGRLCALSRITMAVRRQSD